MKAIKFLSAFALAAGMAACSDDLPDPPAQSYPEPDGIFQDAGLVVAQDAENTSLKEANAANVFVDLATINELVNFPENYELRVDAQVSGTQDFKKFATVTTEITDNKITVNPDLLNGAIQEAITRKPGTYPVYVRLAAYAVRDNTVCRPGGKDVYYGDYKYNVVTLDPAKVIEEAYYLVGDFCDWDISKALKFTNTVAGANEYDNPQFSVKVDVTEAQAVDGYKWMVIPASTYQSKNYADCAYGVKADESGLGGVLTATNKQGDAAGVITNNGPMLITIDMSLDTYSVNYALDQVYAFTSAAKAWVLHTDNYISYTGVAALGSVARFGQEPNLNGILFKQDPNSEPEDDPDFEGVRSGKLTSKSGGKEIKMPVKGTNLYWCDINLAAMTWKVSHIATISVIGDGNGWDLKTASELTPDKDMKVWTAKGVTIGSDFKLNCNGAWELDFGGSPVSTVDGGEQIFNLAFKGSNIPATPGTYDVEVNFGVFPYTVTLK